MKLSLRKPSCQTKRVTPHVGVWIETVYAEAVEMAYKVTPHVGVWIETILSSKKVNHWMSHLM